MIVSHIFEYTKKDCIVHFKWAIRMICKLYPPKQLCKKNPQGRLEKLWDRSQQNKVLWRKQQESPVFIYKFSATFLHSRSSPCLHAHLLGLCPNFPPRRSQISAHLTGDGEKSQEDLSSPSALGQFTWSQPPPGGHWGLSLRKGHTEGAGGWTSLKSLAYSSQPTGVPLGVWVPLHPKKVSSSPCVTLLKKFKSFLLWAFIIENCKHF